MPNRFSELVDTARLRRFFTKFTVNAESGCWEWNAGMSGSGYPCFSGTSAHRLAHIWFVGDVADEEQVDHKCRNKRCVNPAHLENVTAIENMRRAFEARGPVCRNGHQLTEETSRVWRCGGGKTTRYCLTCRAIRLRKAA